MISLSLRSAVRCGSWTSVGSSRRARTSCWVIVEAPRLLPRSESSAAETIADRVEAGVLPEGLVLDRGRRVEQDLGDLVEGDDLALGVAEAGQLDLAGPVVDDRLLGQGVVGQLRRVVEAAVSDDVGADRRRRRAMAPRPARNDEGDDRDPADGGRVGAATARGAGGGSSGGHGRGRTPGADEGAIRGGRTA